MLCKVIPLVRLPAGLGEFDYIFPKHLTQEISPGCIVRIPFRSRVINGIVTQILSDYDGTKKYKDVIASFSSSPLISQNQLKCIEWFSEYYCVSPTLPALMCAPALPATKTLEIPTAPLNNSRTDSSQTLLVYPDQHEKYHYYNSVLQKNISENKQTLILCALAKDAWRLYSYFSNTYHSSVISLATQASPAQHLKEYLLLMSGQPRVIIGTRRSLFYNIPLLSTLILDRSQQREYKQFDLNPRYDTRDVAKKIGEYTCADIIFQSHAPRLEDWNSKHMKKIYSFPTTKDKQITCISLNQEWRGGNGSFLSQKLLDEIDLVLGAKKHIFLYFNRKGFGSSVVCTTCQHLFVCSECHTPTIYSKRTNLLTCSQCIQSQELPICCPICSGSAYRFLGYGIERIAEELKKIFLKTPVIEYVKERNKNTNEQLSQHTPSIIIGTSYFLYEQEDFFSHVGLIGILHGDITISKTDFRSQEYQFQELMYLSCIAQRHTIPLFVQIFQEQKFLFSHTQESLEHTYNNLLKEREKLHLPPITHMIKLIPKNSPSSCEDLSQKLQETFGSTMHYQIKKTQQKKGKEYLILSGREFSKKVVDFLKTLPPGWMIDRDPVTF